MGMIERGVELVEKGIHYPKPYREVHKAFGKAFPSVNIPNFSDLQNSFFESSPFQIVLQRMKNHDYNIFSVSDFIEALVQSETYSNNSSNGKEPFILHNNFSNLFIFAAFGYATIKYLPDVIKNPTITLLTDSLFGLAAFGTLCYERYNKYHEFAHLIHVINAKPGFPEDQNVVEHVTDVAAQKAMQHGPIIDKAISFMVPLISHVYTLNFHLFSGRKLIPASEERNIARQYLNGKRMVVNYSSHTFME